MPFRRHQLRVKIRSLAEESRIIKSEILRAKDATARRDLHLHRVNIVRREARASLLAYAFLRRIPYGAVERYARELPDWKRVERIASKFADQEAHCATFGFAWRLWHTAALIYLGMRDSCPQEALLILEAARRNRYQDYYTGFNARGIDEWTLTSFQP